ncbi:MAG: hypothetical protein J7M13_00855 [Synergistetes bacterium]|nr:hypothetical protein [Synergistota bacterium]
MGSLERIFESRIVMAIISLFLSIAFWYYAVWLGGSRAVERILEVPVKIKNPPEKVLIEHEVNSVEVSLKGSKNLIGEITPRDVETFVDLSGLKPGVYRLQVQTLVPSGVQVVRIKPPYIVVSIRKLVEKEIPVRASTIGSPEEGFLLDELKIIPKSVLLRGPKDLIDKVSYAFITVDLSGASESFETFSKVRLAGLSEGELAELSVLPSRVKVLVSLKPGWPTKIVRIKVNIEGKPKKAYEIGSIEVIPSHITIMGPSSVLERINEVSTPPIDISALEGTSTFEVRLSSPDKSLKFLENSRVKVIVELRERIIEREYLVPVKVVGSSVFLKWRVSPRQVKVRVKGKYTKIRALKAKDIFVSVDVSNLQRKEALLPVEISLPPGVEIVSVKPTSVKVFTVKEGK